MNTFCLFFQRLKQRLKNGLIIFLGPVALLLFYGPLAHGQLGDLSSLQEKNLEQLRSSNEGLANELISDYGTLYLVEKRTLNKYFSLHLRGGNAISSLVDSSNALDLALDYSPRAYYAFGVQLGHNFITKSTATKKIEEEKGVTYETTKKPINYGLLYYQIKPIIGHFSYFNSGSIPVELSLKFSGGLGMNPDLEEPNIPMGAISPSMMMMVSGVWGIVLGLDFLFFSPFDGLKSENTTMAAVGITRIFD